MYAGVKSGDIIYTRKEDNVIGRGTFGTVYRGKLRSRSGRNHQRPEIPLAVKILTVPPKDEPEQKRFLKECEMCQKCYHPSIANIVAWWFMPDWGVACELCRMSLKTVIVEHECGRRVEWDDPDGAHQEWDDTKRSMVAVGIAFALCVVHNRGVMHRDIKPDNIMLDDRMRPKICDFGFARDKPSPAEIEKALETDQRGLQTGGIGTPLYMAPELFGDDDGETELYTTAVDVYAYGMLLYELATLKVPYADKVAMTKWTLRKFVQDGKRPIIPDDVPEGWRKLIEECWSQDPTDRPTMQDVVDRCEELALDNIDESEFNEYLTEIRDGMAAIAE